MSKRPVINYIFGKITAKIPAKKPLAQQCYLLSISIKRAVSPYISVALGFCLLFGQVLEGALQRLAHDVVAVLHNAGVDAGGQHARAVALAL